ncbi:zf-CCHC domain-containing protein [Tanacetum coccineum]|uniref:Zf-CCHC domain-containing protein n=1 Tax=Tanacetum coccineum TaxID=301880 RepID=A0ABQ5JF28_9ASTR
MVDVKKRWKDYSFGLFISSYEWNSPVRRRSLRFGVCSGLGNGSTSSELEARVCIQRRICLGQFDRKLFNTLITSLKALDEGYSSKNFVRKFLRALHPKWRAKAKKEYSDEESLTSGSEDEEYAKVFGISGLLHQVVIAIADRIQELLEYIDVHDNDASESSQPSWGEMCTLMLPEQVKTMKIQVGVQVSRIGERIRHLQLWKCFGRLYSVVIVLDRNIIYEMRKRINGFVRKLRNDKKTFQRSRNDKSKRKCFRCGDPNHLIGECPKQPRGTNQRDFVGGSWSKSGKEDDEKAKDETCLVAQACSEICLGTDLEPNEWIKDSGCTKHMTGN